VFVDAIVVAGDSPRPDVHTFADLGVPQIAQVIRLGAFAQPSFLGLNEIAHVGVFTDLTADANVVRAGELPQQESSITQPGNTMTPSSITVLRITL
jgi:hypothetical protein